MGFVTTCCGFRDTNRRIRLVFTAISHKSHKFMGWLFRILSIRTPNSNKVYHFQERTWLIFWWPLGNLVDITWLLKKFNSNLRRRPGRAKFGTIIPNSWTFLIGCQGGRATKLTEPVLKYWPFCFVKVRALTRLSVSTSA